jgi:hypothetical protein
VHILAVLFQDIQYTPTVFLLSVFRAADGTVLFTVQFLFIVFRQIVCSTTHFLFIVFRAAGRVKQSVRLHKELMLAY